MYWVFTLYLCLLLLRIQMHEAGGIPTVSAMWENRWSFIRTVPIDKLAFWGEFSYTDVSN
jgi:hypothetical protein